jgi:hypothetical protein
MEAQGAGKFGKGKKRPELFVPEGGVSRQKIVADHLALTRPEGSRQKIVAAHMRSGHGFHA